MKTSYIQAAYNHHVSEKNLTNHCFDYHSSQKTDTGISYGDFFVFYAKYIYNSSCTPTYRLLYGIFHITCNINPRPPY